MTEDTMNLRGLLEEPPRATVLATSSASALSA